MRQYVPGDDALDVVWGADKADIFCSDTRACLVGKDLSGVVVLDGTDLYSSTCSTVLYL